MLNEFRTLTNQEVKDMINVLLSYVSHLINVNNIVIIKMCNKLHHTLSNILIKDDSETIKLLEYNMIDEFTNSINVDIDICIEYGIVMEHLNI